jgi:thermitase
MKAFATTCAALLAVLAGCQGAVTVIRPGGIPAAQTGGKPSFAQVPIPVTDLIVTYKPEALDGVIDLGAPGATSLEATDQPGTVVVRFADRTAMEAYAAKLKTDPTVASVEADAPFTVMGAPNDPAFAQQWGHAKIGLPAAWDTVTGNPGVTVAVADTGLDYQHQDIAGAALMLGPDTLNADSDPMDDVGHGTHVAGTIAAVTGNGTGGAGVAHGVRLLAIRVLGASGGSASSVAAGIQAARQLGAKVINLSLGSTSDNSMVRSAVEQAAQAGILVVAAAGNNGSSSPTFPASYESVLAVGATTPTDARASFSNFGSWLDIAAPGLNILSTVPGNGYQSYNGTSMACPHVAAAAGLLWSHHPTATAAQVRQALTTTGAPVTGFSGSPTLRRLSLPDALAALGPVPSATPTPTPTPSAPTETAMRIMQVTIASPTVGTLAFRWRSNLPASGWVEYGPTGGLGQSTAHGPAGLLAHQAEITGLTPGSTLFVRLFAQDGSQTGRSPIYRIQLADLTPSVSPPPPSPTPVPTPSPSPTPTATPIPTPTPTSGGGGGGGGGGGPQPTPTPTWLFEGWGQ